MGGPINIPKINFFVLISLVIILLSCNNNHYMVEAAAARVQYNVVTYGAKADGRTNAAKAFLAAWQLACASASPATVYVPKGTFSISTSLAFQGPCKNRAILVQVDGTLLASSNAAALGANWIIFRQVQGVTLSGGIFNAQGSALWSCKSKSGNCPSGATSLAFSNSKDITIRGVTSVDSQMFHIVINRCQNVQVRGVKVIAPANSPNTDGIHVSMSTGVTILNSKIGTGDDCISIGPGTSNLWIENVQCGPGHGISIGSLGQDLQEAGVQFVTVKSTTFTGTDNGVRIKSWGRASNGFARNVLFQNLTMTNVQNPILIDQNYCPGNRNCPGQFSGVKISDVTYQDIHGSSATQIAVKFDCSKTNPCSRIKLDNVRLSYKNQPARASCANAGGTASGLVQPTSCL